MARQKPGPKPKMDDDKRAKVLGIIESGGSLKDAADIIEVNYHTIRNERRRNLRFSKGLLRALKTGKMRLINKVGKAKAWQAAAWMLERKYGAEYGKRDKVDVTSNGKTLTHLVDRPTFEKV